MVLYAKSYHPLRLMVVSFVPGRVEVVPRQKRLPAIRNRATEPHLFAQDALDFRRRISVDSWLVQILPFLMLFPSSFDSVHESLPGVNSLGRIEKWKLD